MCLICDRIKMIKEDRNPYFVKELKTGYVVIGDHQHFKGYTLFLCKKHKTELFQLEDKVKIQFLEEMSLVAEAVSSAFGAEKMNYDLEQYGSNGKGPVWWYPMEKMYSEENRPSEQELEEMKQKLREELDKKLS